MAHFNIIMPKLGESIIEATITRWLKAPGDSVSLDEPLVEIATDKVDSEIPSPVEGIFVKRLFEEGAVIPVGEIIALIDTGPAGGEVNPAAQTGNTETDITETHSTPVEMPVADTTPFSGDFSHTQRFYSPLVKSIARQEKLTVEELDTIPGSGKEGRLTKSDLMNYLSVRTASPTPTDAPIATSSPHHPITSSPYIEMDRMRKLIADHMVMSVKTSPHVTSIVEVDVSTIVQWREKNKDNVLKRYQEKLTYTHVFMEAMALALKEFPMINASVDGSRILLHPHINIGMAVALPSGNLIVPVIKHVDQKNLLGIIRDVNDIAERARNNKLLPDEVQGGTITLTNLGSFGTLTGTPIINQPQVAIAGVGSITKRPVVLETPQGDVIAIRHMMYLSLSYDHRVVDGALGGKYIYRIKEILEQFDINTSI